MKRAAICAAIAFVVVVPLLLLHTSGAALHNGDEAIYAEMAREMVEEGHLGELTWQGEVLFPRPPGAVWPVALARTIIGPDERAVRWPLALASVLEVSLLILLGALLFRPITGLVAGG